jgi:hypothetical protein
VVESVHANPLVYECNDRPCRTAESAARAALLFKSMPGYFAAFGESDEALAVGALNEVWRRIQSEGIPALLDQDPEAGVAALRTLLESADLRDLINGEVLELLETSPAPIFHARDLVASVAGGLDFEASDPTIFMRPGLVDFEAFADKIGHVGSFYAGYTPVDLSAMSEFLDACATAGVGLPWREVAALPAGASTCGARLTALVTSHRAALAAAEAPYPSRAEDRIGTHVRALVTTSVLQDDAAAAWHSARSQYLAGQPIAWDISFDDVRFGYFGHTADLAHIAANPRGFEDLKTARFSSLGEVTWREALTYSPAEPGLARALELSDGRLSAGGWADLQPTLVLANLGCDQIVFVTREGGAGGFLAGIADLLGIDTGDAQALFDLVDPRSSYHASIAAADAVLCSDWDTPPALDLDAMFAAGYDAPLETRAPFFTSVPNPHPNLHPELGIGGCTLGVADPE